MADTLCRAKLAETETGQSSPLYFDGQVVRAEDLTLDRQSHDQALWRLRRFLHGWGIVAGLGMSEVDGALLIQSGYAICPSGAEIFLPKAIAIPDIVAAVLGTCGPSAPGCAELLTEAAAAPSEKEVTAWVVLRPSDLPTALRAGLPRDCEHPGNNMSPSRLCGTVAVELCCTAPEGHGPKENDCDALLDFLCSEVPLEMVEDHPDPDLVVLGRLRLDREGLSIDMRWRRRLLPVSVLQDVVLACACTPKRHTRPVTEAEVETAPAAPTAPELIATAETRPENTTAGWETLLDYLRADAMIVTEVQPEKPDPAGPVIRTEEVRILEEKGVTPKDLVTRPAAEIAEKAGIEIDVVESLQARTLGVKGRILSPRF